MTRFYLRVSVFRGEYLPEHTLTRLCHHIHTGYLYSTADSFSVPTLLHSILLYIDSACILGFMILQRLHLHSCIVHSVI